nr:zinc finger protein 271-like [Penaeus vannamei]
MQAPPVYPPCVLPPSFAMYRNLQQYHRYSQCQWQNMPPQHFNQHMPLKPALPPPPPPPPSSAPYGQVFLNSALVFLMPLTPGGKHRITRIEEVSKERHMVSDVELRLRRKEKPKFVFSALVSLVQSSQEPPVLRPKERSWKKEFSCFLFYYSTFVVFSMLTNLHTDLRKWEEAIMDPINAPVSILPDRIPLAPVMDKEIFGTGVCIKEELSEGVIEEIYLEIKEEPLDHADEARDEVSKAKEDRELLSFKDLQNLSHEESEKDSWDIEDCNTLSRASFVAEENEKRCSSEEDQAKHKESHREVTHRKVARKLKRFLCEVCGKTFCNKTDIKIHMRVHTKEKPYSCDICNKAFSTKKCQVLHIRVHTKEKPHTCEFCNKAFSRKSDQVRHKRVHTKEKPYICDICSQAFSQKNSLVKHMRIHTNEKPYSCEICNKDFSDKYDLARHIRVHTKEKPYICDVCNKDFSQKSLQVIHMRLHTKEKPYICQICNKAFTRNSCRVRHMKIHTKEKPYICKICKKAFSQNSCRVRHMRVHTKEKQL